MAKRTIKGVQFQGEAVALHNLIGCYNALRGTQWHVVAADYVGGNFDVTFTRSGKPISREEAQAWVEAALKHARD